MSIKRTIENWIEDKKYFPCNISESFSMFAKDENTNCSKSYFYDKFAHLTKTQVIKTGGIYTKSKDIIDTIVQRSIYGVNMKNTFSIDEKPIIINNYRSKKVRVASTHSGKVPSNKIESFKAFDKLKNIYLLCCITYNSVFSYYLSETPINTDIFNYFLFNLISNIQTKEYGQFLLIDNASFHGIDEVITEYMQVKKIGITRTPPLGCLFNPIEEFFSYFDTILKKK